MPVYNATSREGELAEIGESDSPGAVFCDSQGITHLGLRLGIQLHRCPLALAEKCPRNRRRSDMRPKQRRKSPAKAGARELFSRALMTVLTFSGVVLSGTALRAQAVSIKLVNGRNGKPIADKCIRVGVGDKSDLKGRGWSGGDMQTDASGVVTLHLVVGNAAINTQDERRGCAGGVVASPVLKYGNTIGVRPFLAFCQPHGSNYSWLGFEVFSTTNVLQQGVVTPNTCGKARASPKPGQIILFVRPLSWWEKMKE